MRLDDRAHVNRPWQVHEVAADFTLLDVWSLPTPGGPGDFPRLVQLVSHYDPNQSASPVVRGLFAVRWALGDYLGLDRPRKPGDRSAPSLLSRVPLELRTENGQSEEHAALPIQPLFETEDEFAVEIVNRTVHGLLHLGWVPDEDGGYRGQLAVLVKPNGCWGALYLQIISPFRHLIVYPQIEKDIAWNW